MSRDRSITLRRAIAFVALVVAWCALWGDISVANVASGSLAAFVVHVSGLGPAGQGSIRVVPLAKLIGLVAIDLVRSTGNVAYEILTPTDHSEESVVALAVPGEARRHLLLLVVAITLTPGTAVVDTDADAGVLYLHLLHHDRVDEISEHVARLAQLSCAALPVGDTTPEAPGDPA